MATVNDILNLARAWLGKNEADGSHMDIINVYNSHTPLARGYKVKYTDNWCAATISALAIKCNATNIIPLECSCGEMIKLAQQMGVWNEDGSITPNVGDIIMYDWDNQDGWPEHVGIVESVTNNQITVIEGNKSNAVGRRVINVGNASIRGYIQPNYDGSISNNQPSKPQTGNDVAVDYYVKVNTKSGVNCRKEPSVSSAKITAYANGTKLHVTGEKNGWLYVNNTGYVSGQYCVRVSTIEDSMGTPVNYQVRVNTPSGVNCRRGPSADSGKITAYPNGTLLNITYENNGWLYANNKGWVYGQYCTKVGSSSSKPTETYEVTASDLIVRNAPNGKAVGYNGLTADGKKHDTDKDGAIQKGTRVTVLEWSNGWAKIPSGWVSGDYLKKV